MAKATTGTTKRKRLSAEDRRLQIIDVAGQVFLELGPDRASVQKIAELAGVNPALLYRHFRSNVELFETAILAPLEQRVVECISEAELSAGTYGSPEEELLQGHVALLSLLKETAPSISVILFADKFPGAEFFVERIQPRLSAWLRGIVAGHTGKSGSVDNQTLVAAMFGAHLNVALDAHLRGEDLDVAVIARQIKAVFSFGLFERPSDAA